jgi:uracil phosphoribosyltransferase
MNETKAIGDVFIFDHPLIQHKITMMRDKNTNTKDFRDLVNEVAMLMAYEVTRDLSVKDVEIETPMEKMTGKMIAGKDLALVPILRAGLGMVDGMLNLVPSAKVGHIGLYRDPETLEPVEYYCKLPDDVATRDVILLDPMLATGNSAVAAVDFLKQRDIDSIKFVCLIAAPEGIKHLHAAHPDVPIYCAALDDGLNEHAYILPGLGDAGDRLFGTK